MHWIDLLRLAGRNVKHAGIKAWLCIFAISIGIASVNLVFSIGNAAENGVAEEIQQIGISGLAFYSRDSFPIEEEVLQAVANVKGVTAVMPFTLTNGTIRLRNYQTAAGILAIDENLDQLFHLQVLYGELPSKNQVSCHEKIAVIDADFAEKVYQRKNIVGKYISLTVSDIVEKFKVCAVIRSQSSNLTALLGNDTLPCLIYIPYTALSDMDSSKKADKILVASTIEEQNLIAENVKRTLNFLSDSTFSFENLNQYLQSFTNVASLVTKAVRGIASISVIVGGVGVMNTMVCAVDSRVNEVGIYSALGARRSDVIMTFLMESIYLCLIGGLCGVIASYIAETAVRSVTKIVIPWRPENLLVSICVAFFCGLFFGILPAYRAARMDPIQAMRGTGKKGP